MALFGIRIGGKRYSRAQAQVIFDKMAEEITMLQKALNDSKAREGVLRRELSKVLNERDALKEQLLDFPARDDSGRYIKRK